MFSSIKGDVQLMYTILKHSPNVNAKDISNKNALFYAIDSCKGNNADVVISTKSSNIQEFEECSKGTIG